MPSDLTFVAVGQSLIKRDIRHHSDPRFRAVVDLVRQADVAFTNLETTIRGPYGGWPMKSNFFGCAEPVVLDALREIGFNVLSLSNNHAFDLGPGGTLSTLYEVRRRGFIHAGIGIDQTDAARAGIGTLPCGRVALIAMDAGPAPDHVYAQNESETEFNRVPSRPGINRLRVDQHFTITEEEMATLSRIKQTLGHREGQAKVQRLSPESGGPDEMDFYGLHFACGRTHERRGVPDAEDVRRHLTVIQEAAARGDFVIVYVHHHHWEPDLQAVPGWAQNFAYQCITAGADVYVSHGVPLLQGIEIYKRRPILHGLGNFIFHSSNPRRWFNQKAWRSVVATCRFGSDGTLSSIVLDPIVIGGEEALQREDFTAREAPYRAASEMGQAILEDIAQQSRLFGTKVDIRDARGHVFVQ